MKASFLQLALLMLVVSSPLAAVTQAHIEQLFIAFSKGEWVRAKQIAERLDVEEPGAAFFTPFAEATAYIAQGRCKEGEPLAQQTIDVMPSFLPAYDLLAVCMRKDGRAVSAGKLYRNIANGMDEGPERELLLARAHAIYPDMSTRYYVDGTITPTTNANRATYETNIGPFTISDQARQKKGVQVQLSATVEKPIFATDRLLSSVSLRFGSAYQSYDKSFFPFARITSQTRLALSQTASMTGSAFYEYTLKGRERYLDQTGFRLDFAKHIQKGFNLGVGLGVTRYNYTDDDRDGVGLDASVRLAKPIGTNNRVSLSVTGITQMREHDRHSYNQIGVDAEWEHRFDNGFIASLGAGGFLKELKSDAPLMVEKQRDKQAYGRIGVSHKKLSFKNLRPELTYTIARQWSNDAFSRYVAHDVGIRVKGAF